MDKINKNYVYSNRTKTSEDIERSALNNYLGTTTVRRGTTGWITDTNVWNTNIGVHDKTAVLTVMFIHNDVECNILALLNSGI